MRMCLLNYYEIRVCLKDFLQKILKDCATLASHSKRKTVTLGDVNWSLKNNGVRMYGIDRKYHFLLGGSDLIDNVYNNVLTLGLSIQLIWI